MNIFFESWFAIIIFLAIGVIAIIKTLKKSDGLLSIKVRSVFGGIGAILYSISLAIAKLLGKV